MSNIQSWSLHHCTIIQRCSSNAILSVVFAEPEIACYSKYGSRTSSIGIIWKACLESSSQGPTDLRPAESESAF